MNFFAILRNTLLIGRATSALHRLDIPAAPKLKHFSDLPGQVQQLDHSHGLLYQEFWAGP